MMTVSPQTASAAERARIAETGMYRPDMESDACGVGLVAATDGVASRRVVVAGIEALKAVWHRGAVDADGKTGDGAGIHVELPLDFFREHIERAGHAPKPNLLAVGMVFLPRTDLAAQETCRIIVESEIIGFGYKVYGWRQVPVDVSCIGEKAMLSRPEIEQIMIAGPLPGPDGNAAALEAFEKDLFPFAAVSRSGLSRRKRRASTSARSAPARLSIRACSSQRSYRNSILTCSMRASSPASSFITSATAPTPSRNGGWRSLSAASPIMARSIRCAATPTG